MLIGSIGELTDAPIARADDFSQVIDNIQASETLGQMDLGEATTAFASGDNLQGLYDTFVGLDDSTFVPEAWFLQGGLDTVTGAGEAFAANDLSLGLFDSIGVVAVFDVSDPQVLALGLASGL